MDHDIEDILKRMPLREPSAQLDERVLGEERALPFTEIAAQRMRRWRMTAGLSAAAMLILAATLALNLMNDNTPHPFAATPDDPKPLMFAPVRRDTVVSHLSDEGVIFLSDDLPMRRIKRQTIQRVQWVDEARSIQMETTLPPREQWMLVPLSFD